MAEEAAAVAAKYHGSKPALSEAGPQQLLGTLQDVPGLFGNFAPRHSLDLPHLSSPSVRSLHAGGLRLNCVAPHSRPCIRYGAMCQR